MMVYANRPFLPLAARLSVVLGTLIFAGVWSAMARAEDVVFSGVEGSSNGRYAYLGAVMPLEGEALGRGWYRKIVVSMIRYRFTSSDRGPLEDVLGSVPGIEGGVGHAWRFDARTLDLSASVGYRDIRLSPFEPSDERTGQVITLNPQLMAYTPLVGHVDADLIANYAFGLGSSFARLRAGFRPAERWRTGIEAKHLRGEHYETHAAGVFLAIPLSGKFTLELTAGKEKPRDDPSVSYGGMAFSAVF
ncbi:MAG: cellulose biosynthesis protein BcsS [Oxalobacteraceae bacterium]